MPNSLPRSSIPRLELLIQRVRRQRLYHQLSWSLLAACFIPFSLILIDSHADLPLKTRFAGLLVWLMIVLLLGVRLYRCYKTPISGEEVAPAVEANFPRLAERSATPFPTGTALASLLASASLILAMLLPGFLLPSAKEYVRRFVAPWSTSPPAVDYRIIVTSGDPALKRGEPITLTAYTEATKSDALLPTSATLVLIPADGQEERLAMTADEGNIWHGRKESAEASFSYRVEAGGAVSETHRVTVVEPILLTESRVRITLPEYARRPGQTPTPIEGRGELSVLEQSELEFNFRFNPRPTKATLTLIPERLGDERPREELFNLPLDAEGRSTLHLTARRSGMLKLRAEGDRQVISDFSIQPLRIFTDEPPKFLRVTGLSDRPRDIRPDEHLRIEATVSDDIAVSRVVLDWRINEGSIQAIPFQGKGLPGTLVDAKWMHFFKDRVKQGDILYCRIAVTDNRNVPGTGLTPQTTFFPSQNAWSEFHINNAAEPLTEQDILRRQREIEAKLKAIRDDLQAAGKVANQLRLNRQRVLDTDQKELARQLPEDLRHTATQLDLLSQDVGITPELRPLADAIGSLGGRDVKEAEASAAKGRDEGKMEERSKRFQGSETALTQAVERLDELLKRNTRLARDRLDRMKLEFLFEEQAELARRTQQSPHTEIDLLAYEQQAIVEQFKKLQEQSEAIRLALQSARHTQTQQMTNEAERLAQDLRTLNEAMKKSDSRVLEARLAELRRRQEEFASKGKELAERTDAATRAALASPLNLDSLKRAQEALTQGNLDEAIKEQEKARQELNRLATDLEKGAANSLDPREAARQLARLQANARSYLAQETAINPLAQLTPEVRESLQKKQEAIVQAIDDLRTYSTETESLKKRAVGSSRLAQEALKKGDEKNADKAMEATQQQLEKLADKLPTPEQRLAQAKLVVAQFRHVQEDLRHRVDEAIEKIAGRNADDPATQHDLTKLLSDVAALQATLAEQLERMDAPGQEGRQKRTARALQQAANDLINGRPQDLVATQQAARRELDRLEQGLQGLIPADEKVTDLLRRQKALADAASANPDPVRRRELTRRQGELAKELEKLASPEAAATLGEAIEAARHAEIALRQPNTKVDDLIRLTRAAEQKLLQLDRQLQGHEKPDEAAKRLAGRQRQQASESAKKSESTVAEGRRKAQQTAEELRNLRTGSDSQHLQKHALEALNRATQTLDVSAHARAQQEAARTLEQLAKQLQPNPEKTLLEAIEELSRQQKELVGASSMKLTREMLVRQMKQQRELARQLANIAILKKAETQRAVLRAMNKALGEMARQNREATSQVQKEAADLLDRLTHELRQEMEKQAEARYSQLPTRQQAEEARRLAEEQATLRDEAMKAANELAKENQRADNPVADLVRQQRKLVRDGEDLVKLMGDRPGEETVSARSAIEAAKQAYDQLRNGNLNEARQAGERGVKLWEKLDAATEFGQKAHLLARQQRDVNQQIDGLSQDPAHARMQQKSQADQLQDLLKHLKANMEKLAGPGREAVQLLQRADESLQKAQEAYRKGESTQGVRSRDEAAESIERAARLVRASLPKAITASLMGQAMKQAQEEMAEADSRLKQNQQTEAARSMERAAQSLLQAIQHLGERSDPPGTSRLNPSPSRK